MYNKRASQQTPKRIIFVISCIFSFMDITIPAHAVESFMSKKGGVFHFSGGKS